MTVWSCHLLRCIGNPLFYKRSKCIVLMRKRLSACSTGHCFVAFLPSQILALVKSLQFTLSLYHFTYPFSCVFVTPKIETFKLFKQSLFLQLICLVIKYKCNKVVTSEKSRNRRVNDYFIKRIICNSEQAANTVCISSLL